jgi:hypothetical protein|tara:strand:+ start:5241 stop:7223 length:1983 start_codon:yes stop_codon:yes gene_type:complete
MATKFVTNLDLNQNQLLNGSFQSLASDPASGNFEGRLIYNSTEKVLKVYTGSAWRKALHATASNTTALTVSESNGTVTFAIAAADGSDPGLQSSAHYTQAAGATDANTASTVVKRDASGDFTAGTITAALTGAVTGNASTATEATNVTAVANNATDETVYPTFVDGATGTQGIETDTGLTYNPSTGALTSTTFAGALTGNVTGQVSTLSNHDTDDLSEGATNEYFTDARVRANRLDQMASPTAAVSANSQKITDLATPTASTDAANKGYVDDRSAGLDPKESVVAATTAAINLSTDLENGDTLDGITLATGERVLVKDQGTASENGIYVVVASGAASRATDFDATAEVTAGAFFFVEEGTANASRGFVLQAKSGGGSFTVGTDALSFSQFSGAGQITAGAGLGQSGDELSVNVDTTTLEISSDALRIAASAAGNGLTGGGASALAVSVDTTTIEISGDALRVSASAAGDGLTGGGASALAANVASDGGVEISADALQVKLHSGVAGLATTSNGLAIKSDIAGTGVTFTAGVLSADASDLAASGAGGVTGTLPIANGGTGATTAANARANGYLAAGDSSTGSRSTSVPVLSRSVAQTIGDGSATAYVVTHGLGTRDVIVQVYDASSYDTVIADTVRTNTNACTVTFSSAPSSNAYRVVVTG